MERWVSAKKAHKMFGLNEKKLAELEKNGKIQTIRTVGDKKMYLVSNFLSEGMQIIENKNFFQKIILKFFSWFKKET